MNQRGQAVVELLLSLLVFGPILAGGTAIVFAGYRHLRCERAVFEKARSALNTHHSTTANPPSFDGTVVERREWGVEASRKCDSGLFGSFETVKLEQIP